LGGGGGGTGHEAIYNLSDFKNYVMKIMSKSPSRHHVRLQGKLKLTDKEKHLHIHTILFIFPYSNVPVISRYQQLI
jgi:hypothetical protein